MDDYQSSFICKINEDITIEQEPIVLFMNPPIFCYTVLETGEEFRGRTGDIKTDYYTWKASQDKSHDTKTI